MHSLHKMLVEMSVNSTITISVHLHVSLTLHTDIYLVITWERHNSHFSIHCTSFLQLNDDSESFWYFKIEDNASLQKIFV